MQLADPTKYTEVTQEQFDPFKNLARARGMNIGGNSDNVKFDEIPVHALLGEHKRISAVE